MENNASSPAPIVTSSESQANSKLLISTLWVFSLILVGIVGFFFGKGVSSPQASSNVVATAQTELTSTPTPELSSSTVLAANASISITPPSSTTSTTACAKTGFAQKWEYLTAYVVKQDDTIEKIATSQLNDASRVNEILQINGVGPLVVGSTLYLPPSNIPKSSGNLKEVYGKLVDKDAASWHLSFTADANGQGLLIPSFLFQSVPNKDSFKIGDCLKVFLDDGYTVYSVSLQ